MRDVEGTCRLIITLWTKTHIHVEHICIYNSYILTHAHIYIYIFIYYIHIPIYTYIYIYMYMSVRHGWSQCVSRLWEPLKASGQAVLQCSAFLISIILWKTISTVSENKATISMGNHLRSNLYPPICTGTCGDRTPTSPPRTLYPIIIHYYIISSSTISGWYPPFLMVHHRATNGNAVPWHHPEARRALLRGGTEA